MYSLSNEERRRRALGKHASADELRGTVAELKTQLAGKPDPPVSDMAKALCLDALYDDLFRLASIPLHGSLLSVTNVFPASRTWSRDAMKRSLCGSESPK